INVDAVVIMCSGEFPEFESYSIVIYPDKILKGIVSSIHYKGNAAVLVPSTDHLQYGYNKWSKYFPEPLIVPISPYTAGLDEFVQVGQRLRKADVKLVVMDCVGYSFRQKKALRKTAPSAKIMSTRGVVGKIVSELF
ncbi:MAG: AroM family protein, partial [Candidatus Caldarchaeum sp.]